MTTLSLRMTTPYPPEIFTCYNRIVDEFVQKTILTSK